VRAITWIGGLVCAGPALEGGINGPYKAFFIGLGVIVIVYGEMRAVNQGLYTDPNGILVKGYWSPRRARWEEIGSFERARYLTGYGIFVVLLDGRRWYVPGLSGSAPMQSDDGTLVEGHEVAAFLNRLLRAVRR